MERICGVTDEALKELVDLAAQVESDASLCPVDVSYRIVKEGLKNSCGKGVMCRDGLRQVFTILQDVVNGKGQNDDVEMLKEILDVIRECADCDLSYTVADQLLKLIENNEAEFDMHTKRKSCKALVCPGAYEIYIDPAACKGCGACKAAAPVGVIAGSEGMIHVIKKNAIEIKNQEFYDLCPNQAIKKAGRVKPPLPTEPVPVGSFGAGAGGGRRGRRGAAGAVKAAAAAPKETKAPVKTETKTPVSPKPVIAPKPVVAPKMPEAVKPAASPSPVKPAAVKATPAASLAEGGVRCRRRRGGAEESPLAAEKSSQTETSPVSTASAETGSTENAPRRRRRRRE